MSGATSEGFAYLGEKTIHESWFRLVVGEFSAPDGSSFTREIIRHPGAVSVVPVQDDGETVLMVRQYRTAVDAELLEIPAGRRDAPGEPPVDTAARELAEEVGVQAERFELLTDMFMAPGLIDERQEVYLATGLSPTPPSAHSIEEAHLTVEEVHLSDLAQLVASGTIVDAKSILGLYLARERLAAR